MNSKMIAGGLALVFVAMAMPSNAYHIFDNTAANGTNSGLEPLEWGAQIGTDVYAPTTDPFTNDQEPCATLAVLRTLHPEIDALMDILCTDDPAFEEGEWVTGAGLVACETNEDMTAPGNSGAGGLCFMNPGFSGSPCAFDSSNDGRSNGNYNEYNGGACVAWATDSDLPVIQNVARNWFEITMHNSFPSGPSNTVLFTGEIGDLGCGVPSASFQYDEQFAYTVADGHVAGFPTTPPAPGVFGSYKVASISAPTGTECSPYPMYY